MESLREGARLLTKGGRLLIVDFETHNIESFRSDYAHRRLGFSDDDIASWMHSSGMALIETRNIETDKGRPNIKLWLGEKTSQERISQWQSH